MIPLLFASDELGFAESDALGSLPDALSCHVTTDSTAHAELRLRYPLAGESFSLLAYDLLILAKPDPDTKPQPYRIYAISRPINGVVTVSARHLLYDIAGVPVSPFSLTGATSAEAISAVNSHALFISSLRSIQSSGSAVKDFSVTVPTSLREVLLTGEDSLAAVYCLEAKFDRTTLTLYPSRGVVRDLTLRYGVDLVDLNQDESIANVYTGVLPYWHGTQATETVVDGETVYSQEEVTVLGATQYAAAGANRTKKILPVDFSAYFEDPPTAAQLNTLGAQYIASKGVGIPDISLRLSYAQLGQQVDLYDTINVEFPALGVTTTARITSVTFDALNEVYTSLQAGTRPQLTDTLRDASRLKTGKLPRERIAARSVGGYALDTAAVSERALAAYAVTRAKLDALAVGAGQLDTGAVTTEKLANQSVTSLKIVDNAVVTEKIAADAVTAAKMLDGAVTVSKISNGAVTSGKIAVNAVTAEKILNGSVTEYKLADGSVSAAKVLAQAISYAKLDGTLQAFYTDVLAANAIFASVISADRSVTASVVSARSYLVVAGNIYRPTTYQVKDTHNTYTVKNTFGHQRKNVYNNDNNTIGHTTDYWYTASLSKGSEDNVTYTLHVLGLYSVD